MQFVYPSFLWALSALSIPVIIHLFHFRRYKRVLFSDVRFLKQLQEQNKSKQKIKDWLILLSRLLALACLVMAFAQPFIPLGNTANVSGQKVVSLFVDNSFSMHAQGEEGILLEVAKAKARAIVQAYGANDKFQVLTNNLSGTEQRLLSKTEAIERIDVIAPSVASANLVDVEAKQHYAFQQTDGYHAAYFISDFQQNQFNIAQLKTDSLQQRYFIPVQNITANNISVDSIYFTSPQVKLNTPFIAKVKLTNHGNDAAEGVVVKVMLNNAQKALVNTNIGGHESVELEVNLTCTQGGWQKGEVVITDHPITFDDHLYFAFQPAVKNSILTIGNAPNKFFDAVFANDSYYELTHNSYSNINYQNLSNYQLLVLDECSEISSGLAAELDKYLEQGGQVFIIPATTINQSVNDFCAKYRLPSFGANVRQQLKVAHLNTQHPVFANVFSKLNNQTDLPWVASYLSLQTNSQTAGKSLMELNNGASVLWQARAKKGSIVQLAFGLNSTNSGLPNHSLIVPMLLNMAMGVQKQQQLYYVLKQNQWVVVPSKISGADKLVTIKGATQDFTTEISQWQQLQIIPTEILTSEGWFDAKLKQQPAPFYTFAYNNNRKESDMRFWDENNLTELTKQLPHVTINDATAKVLGAQLSMELSGKVLWRWFIVCALLFVLVEIALIRLLK